MSVFNELSIISWNVRGFANGNNQNHMREILRRYKLEFVFVYETRTPFATGKKLFKKAGYQMLEVVEA